MNYYLNIDFYNLKSSDLNNGVVLEKFKTLQQKTDYTCGPCCVQMVLNFYGDFNVDEESISILLKTSHETGTKLVNIVKTVEKLGYSTISSLNIRKNRDGLVFSNYESFKKFVIDSIKNGEPIIVENVDYGGHYKVIIGLDQPSDNEDMDILIFADPSDFYDGVSDGYNYFPAERFFYMWFDDHCLLKKNRKQPFLVIKKKQD